jgi:hypothetical protein
MVPEACLRARRDFVSGLLDVLPGPAPMSILPPSPDESALLNVR